MVIDWVSWVLEQTGAQAVTENRLLQNLWGGYGELRRLGLRGGDVPSVILKRVIPPDHLAESCSDRRKQRSYEVEWAWYQGASRRCDEGCRVAACLAAEPSLLLLEDLNTAGFFPGRPPRIGAGLRWLAHFHARFLGERPAGLWEQGGYWHLDTRPEEWQRMPAGILKDIAQSLDLLLREARYQTLMHGDSKPANFCWKGDREAAAVDFQYVGVGCGIRDVAYFLDCCGCEEEVEGWLDFYFAVLREARGQSDDGLESEWRELFPVAWADYCRFYQGWGRGTPPGPYSQRQINAALRLLTKV